MTPTTTVPAHVTDLLTRLTGDEKHEAAATSTLDVLWVLYDRVLRVDPEHPRRPDRDRFVLSKGHGPASYYAVLAARGFLAPEELDRFGRRDGILGNHPDSTLVPGVEASTGSLGHGLALGAGMAAGLRARGSAARVVVLVGDAELQEGSNWEAIGYAAHAGLGSLTCVVVDNGSRSWPAGSWRPMLAAAGWSATTVDGRDHDALADALSSVEASRPTAVIADVRENR